MDRSKRWTRWVLLLGLSILTGCSTKPVYDEGPILELYPSRFADGLYVHAFFQFSSPQSTGWKSFLDQDPRRITLQKNYARISVESWITKPPKTQDTTEILAFIAGQRQAYWNQLKGYVLEEFRAYPDSTCPTTPCYRYDWLASHEKTRRSSAFILDGHGYLFAHPEMVDLRKKDPTFPLFRVVGVTYALVYPPSSKEHLEGDDFTHVLNSLRFRNGKQTY